MSATAAVLRMEVTIPGRPGAEIIAQPSGLPNAANPMRFFIWLQALVSGFVSGLGARVRFAVEDSTPTAATGTIAFATAIAGNWVAIGGVRYTAVAGAATASSGQFSIDTSDTATGDSFVLALAAYPPGRPIAVGVNSAGSVALTAVVPGRAMNDTLLTDSGATITLTQFSGGRDAGSLQSVVGTFTGIATANDTHVIGGASGVTLTWKASAANENEITIPGTAALSATALIAAINAHTKLRGLLLASSGGSGIANIQLQMTGRIGALITITESVANFTQTATVFAPTQVSTWIADTAVYAVGASTTAQA